MLKVCELEVTAPSIFMNEKGSGLSPMLASGVVGGGGATGGGATGGCATGGGAAGGGGWVLGAGVTRFSNRSMKPLKPPPWGGLFWANAHCGLILARQLNTKHRRKSFLNR